MEYPLLTSATKIEFPGNINLPDDWPVVVKGETGYTIGHQMSTSPVWGAERDMLIDSINEGWSWEFVQTNQSSDNNYKKIEGIIVCWPNELPADPKERAIKLRAIRLEIKDCYIREEYEEQKNGLL